MFKEKNKRGISPLIATVILIGFIVVIASTVFLWSKSYIMEKAEKEGEIAKMTLQCEEVEYDIISCDETTLTIENKANIKIYKFMIVYESGGSEETPEGLNVYELKDLTISSCSSSDFKVVPYLKPDGRGAKSIPCSNKLKIVLKQI